MSRQKASKIITNISVALATVLAWLSGFVVMQIVYDSFVAAIIFGTIWAIIVFCESRFSYISLKSDGRIEITKEEVKSNLWQIIAAFFVALLVTIPLELKLFVTEVSAVDPTITHDLGLQLHELCVHVAEKWFPMTLITIIVITIYQVPIFARMMSEE